jgi:putative hydrolase of the HAD superfamily
VSQPQSAEGGLDPGSIGAVVFDVNGTLVDILTDDGADAVFRAAGHYLTYQGIDVKRHPLREEYFRLLREQQQASTQRYPEFDAVEIWRTIVATHATDFTRSLPPERLHLLPVALTELTRGVARRRLKLYPHVREVLDELRRHVPLAVVTDAQSSYARAELHKVGLIDHFDPIVVSGDHGFRKPDPRLFRMALDALGVPAGDSVYVGNDIHRDIWGARKVGMRTVMVDSVQGSKHHEDCVPDHTITDHRDLPKILGLDR